MRAMKLVYLALKMYFYWALSSKFFLLRRFMLKILKILIYICFSLQSECPKILTHFTSRQLSLLYWCFAIRLKQCEGQHRAEQGKRLLQNLRWKQTLVCRAHWHTRKNCLEVVFLKETIKKGFLSWQVNSPIKAKHGRNMDKFL